MYFSIVVAIAPSSSPSSPCVQVVLVPARVNLVQLQVTQFQAAPVVYHPLLQLQMTQFQVPVLLLPPLRTYQIRVLVVHDLRASRTPLHRHRLLQTRLAVPVLVLNLSYLPMFPAATVHVLRPPLLLQIQFQAVPGPVLPPLRLLDPCLFWNWCVTCDTQH